VFLGDGNDIVVTALATSASTTSVPLMLVMVTIPSLSAESFLTEAMSF
jgi:hypothetical protein